MTFEFADPGWDFTSLFWTGLPLALLLLGAAVCGLIYRARGYRSNADEWAYGFLWIALAWGILGFLMGGGITGVFIYGGKVEAARTAALAELGFDKVKYEESEDYNVPFTASLEGDYFEGYAILLSDADGIYKYQVTELAK